MLVSAVMIATGIWHLRREASGNAVRAGLLNWAGMIAGAIVIVVSFAMDYRNIMAGGTPHPFNWGIFSLGMGLGVGSYLNAAAKARSIGKEVAASTATTLAGTSAVDGSF